MPPGDALGPIPGLGIPPIPPGPEFKDGVFDFGTNKGWSRGTSGGVLYMLAGGVANSSAAGGRISRFGVEAHPASPIIPAATVNHTAFMRTPPHLENGREYRGASVRQAEAHYFPAFAVVNRSSTSFQFTVFHHAST